MRATESQAEDLLFKEKRTKTEGLQSYKETLRARLGEKSEEFKPVSTSANLFGFSRGKKGKRYSNPHVKTII